MKSIDNTHVEKKLISKRKRLSYLNGCIPWLRRKKNRIFIILCISFVITLLCEFALLYSSEPESISTTLIIGLAVPLIVVEVTVCSSQISETVRVILECEREIYEICEYIFINDSFDEKSDEKKLYEKYTASPKN